MRRKIAVGNWKMIGLKAAIDEIRSLDADVSGKSDVVICPPAHLLFAAAEAANEKIAIGAQDCHPLEKGAYTGNLSAEMIAETGATYVLCGHSERRRDHGETNALVREKALAAHRGGVVAVVCVGESLEQRESGRTLDVIAEELLASMPEEGCTAANTVIGYEPLWAIGTGHIPSPAQIGEVHNRIREILIASFGPIEGAGIRIIYGGSVKASNAEEIFAASNVDGALVGGASNKAVDFLPIIQALDAAN